VQHYLLSVKLFAVSLSASWLLVGITFWEAILNSMSLPALILSCAALVTALSTSGAAVWAVFVTRKANADAHADTVARLKTAEVERDKATAIIVGKADVIAGHVNSAATKSDEQIRALLASNAMLVEHIAELKEERALLRQSTATASAAAATPESVARAEGKAAGVEQERLRVEEKKTLPQ
jgi:4-hydroxy-3-methylbut-2-enyl diphosphate reductase IspH